MGMASDPSPVPTPVARPVPPSQGPQQGPGPQEVTSKTKIASKRRGLLYPSSPDES